MRVVHFFFWVTSPPQKNMCITSWNPTATNLHRQTEDLRWSRSSVYCCSNPQNPWKGCNKSWNLLWLVVFHQPIWKIWSSNWIISPSKGEIKHIFENTMKSYDSMDCWSFHSLKVLDSFWTHIFWGDFIAPTETKAESCIFMHHVVIISQEVFSLYGWHVGRIEQNTLSRSDQKLDHGTSRG